MKTLILPLLSLLVRTHVALPVPLQTPHKASDITRCGTAPTTNSLYMEATHLCMEVLPLQSPSVLPSVYDEERSIDTSKGPFKRLTEPLQPNAILEPTTPNPPRIHEQAQERINNIALLLLDSILPVICVIAAWIWARRLRRQGKIIKMLWMIAFTAYVHATIASDERSFGPSRFCALLIYTIFHVSYCQLRLGNINNVRTFVIATAALAASFFTLVYFSGLGEFLETNLSVSLAFLLLPIHLVVFEVAAALVRDG